jgi:hypothetical protein
LIFGSVVTFGKPALFEQPMSFEIARGAYAHSPFGEDACFFVLLIDVGVVVGGHQRVLAGFIVHGFYLLQF